MITADQVCRYVAMLLFLWLGAQGLWSGFWQLDDAGTLGQQTQTALQFAFNALGLAAGVFLLLKRPVPLAIEWCWTIALALAGGIAAVAWGETSIPIGVAAGLSTALVAFTIVWLGRRGRSQASGVEADARESS
jgi:hypothetical protein